MTERKPFVHFFLGLHGMTIDDFIIISTIALYNHIYAISQKI